MKRFSFFFLLASGLIAATLSLHSCQKETINEAAKTVKPGTILSDRAVNGLIIGVTVYDGITPSQVVTIDQTTGLVINSQPAFYIDNAGNTITLDNLKGICLTSWGQYFLTTGNPVNPVLGSTSIYSNALFKVNPQNGQCSYASTSNVGTVSDLEHDPSNLNFYGLLDNSNAIIRISDNNNNYGNYFAAVPITGIAAGYTLKGLSLIRDGNGMYYVGCATSPKPTNPAKLYTVPVTGGLATFMTDLGPATDLSTGNCGIGFDLNLNRMLINRNGNPPSIGAGINAFGWNPPFGATTNTFPWGAVGVNFEDLTSSVY